jgi:hypothetical protein
MEFRKYLFYLQRVCGKEADWVRQRWARHSVFNHPTQRPGSMQFVFEWLWVHYKAENHIRWHCCWCFQCAGTKILMLKRLFLRSPCIQYVLLLLNKEYRTNYSAKFKNILSAHCTPHCWSNINSIIDLWKLLEIIDCSYCSYIYENS